MKDYIAHYPTERNHQGKSNRTTCCCSSGSAKRTTTSQCDAAIGWADFCGTIIKRQRELAVRLWLHNPDRMRTQSCAQFCTDLSERFSNPSPEGGLS
jgi:hypothetical protein